MRRRRAIWRLWPIIGLTPLLLGLSAGQAAAPAEPTGFRALSGPAAAGFALPGDTRLVRKIGLDAYGLTYERHQQTFGGSADVLGGQITVFRDGAGRTSLVIGAHYREIVPSNSVAVTRAAAHRVVEQEIGADGERTTELMINPGTGRFFYNVETRRFDSRWIHWIDAQTGRVLRRFDAIANDHGTGVKSDVKDVNGPDNAAAADDLTTFHGGSGHGATGSHWDLFSNDNRQLTYDARNKQSLLYYATDADNHWTVVTSDRKSPGHPALVDAHYYARVTDRYLETRHGLDWKADCGYSAMQSVGHYKRNYSNAFWNGTYTVYGDGDGVSFREFSGALDVVAHEHVHGVTDCTSRLLYQDESGALNESFSDILGSSAEFFAGEATSSNCVRAAGQSACADWWISEDIALAADDKPGFRNMADPAEDGHPDHYSERQVGGGDNGGIHSNSGIPNHAYYLLVNGGANAGEARGHSHSGPTVTGIGLADAETIFFLGFTGLPTNATMCQARAATETAATSRFGAASQQRTSTANAWRAVGLTDAVCGIGSNTAPIANNVSTATDEDTPLVVTLSGSDAQQCELTFSVVSPPANGSLGAISGSACTSGSPNTDTATVTYTPGANFNGSDSFTYKVNDGTADSNTATVSITVNAVSYADLVLGDSPAAYWRLGETSGSTAVDSSGNGNGGAYENSPTLGAPALIADVNPSVDFAGTGDRVIVPSSTSLIPSAAVSVEAWVNLDALSPTLWSYHTIANKSGSYWLRVDNLGGTHRFRFIIRQGGVYYAVTASSVSVAPATTYHVVGTYDGAAVRIYVNGSAQGTVTRTGPLDQTSFALQISSASGFGCDGRIDEVAVFSQALTASQIASHYNEG